MSLEKRRPPLTTIFLWIVGVLTLVLTGYGVFTGVVLKKLECAMASQQVGLQGNLRS